MKKASLYLVSISLFWLIVFLPPSNKAWLQMMGSLIETDLVTSRPSPDPPGDESPMRDAVKEAPIAGNLRTKSIMDRQGVERPQGITLLTMQKNGHIYIQLDEVKKHLPIEVQADEHAGIILLRYLDTEMEWVRNNPVMKVNGIFIPMEPTPLIQDHEVWIPVSLLQQHFKQSLMIERDRVVWFVDVKDVPVFAPKPNLPAYSVQGMIQYLSFLEAPIKGAHVSTRDSHLPGAPRTYRNGVHEGLDWYSYGTGVEVTKDTAIYSIAEGTVVRADHDYQEMSAAEREEVLSAGMDNDGQTPEYLLDRLRGRSVWVQYDKGVLARYVHLDRIADQVRVGQKIKAGEIIGYAGNSGTSDGVKGNDAGVHLHLDLLLYGDWFWERYRPEERREILEGVFNP